MDDAAVTTVAGGVASSAILAVMVHLLWLIEGHPWWVPVLCGIALNVSLWQPTALLFVFGCSRCRPLWMGISLLAFSTGWIASAALERCAWTLLRRTAGPEARELLALGALAAGYAIVFVVMHGSLAVAVLVHARANPDRV